jgi:autotransporter-associated beta strand protein
MLRVGPIKLKKILHLMKKYALPHLFLVLTLLNFEQTQAQVTNTITNAYGPATIGSGTTSLITNGATIAGLINNNGQLLFFQSSAITNAFVVSGTGTLAQAGTGTTILTASNTYSKGTTISSGTLQVGDGGTNGTLGTTNVTNNASLVFNRSDTFTVSNTISGSGSLRREQAPRSFLQQATVTPAALLLMQARSWFRDVLET